MAKEFKPHMMYGDGQEEMANTNQEHLDLKEKGWGHTAPTKFTMSGFPEHSTSALKAKAKGMDGKACWKGYSLQGTKKKGGKEVPNCVKEDEVKAGYGKKKASKKKAVKSQP